MPPDGVPSNPVGAAPAAAPARRRAGHLWLLPVVALGLALAFAGPIAGRLHGRAGPVVDNGDLVLYLQYAAQAHRTGVLRDPSTGGARTLYPGLILALPALAARGLGLGPLAILAAWRLWAALGLAAGLYALFWVWLRRAWAAALAAACVLAEPGTAWVGWSLRALLAAARGRHPPPLPSLQPLWRIVDPAVSLTVLLAFAVALAVLRARYPEGAGLRRWLGAPTAARWWFLAAAAGLGVVFYAYFYYWTAAVLALAIALLADRRGWRVYLAVGVAGGLLGVPAIWRGFALRAGTAPGAMARLNLFLHVAPFSGRVRHLGALALLLLLLPVARRQRACAYVWSLGVAALLLSDSQLLTGLQIQNNHWYRFLVHPVVAMLVAAGAALWLQARRRWRRAGLALAAVVIAGGLGAHALVAARQARTRWSRDLAGFAQRPPRAWAALAAPRPAAAPEPTVAGSLAYADDASILYPVRPLSGYAALVSPSLSDRAWEWRWALNEYAGGRGPDRVGGDLDRMLRHLFGSLRGRSPDGPIMALAEEDALIAASRRDYAAIAAAPRPYLRRFGVGWILLRAGRQPPQALRRLAAPAESNPLWSLWRVP